MRKPRHVDLLHFSKILDTPSKKLSTFGQSSSNDFRLDCFLFSRTNVTPEKCQLKTLTDCKEGDVLLFLNLDRVPDEIAGGNTVRGSISSSCFLNESMVTTVDVSEVMTATAPKENTFRPQVPRVDLAS